MLVNSITKTRIPAPQAYNAFTDITFFKGTYYVVFRSGTGHVSPTGKILLYSSQDLTEWNLEYEITEENIDLRDPRIKVMDDQLYILCFSLNYSDSAFKRFAPWDSFLFSYNPEKKELKTTKRFLYSDLNGIVWSIAKWNGKYYLSGYEFQTGHSVAFLWQADSLEGGWKVVFNFPDDQIPPNMGYTEIDIVEGSDCLYLLSRVDSDSVNRIRKADGLKQYRSQLKERKKNRKKIGLKKNRDGKWFSVIEFKSPSDWKVTHYPIYLKGPRGIFLKNTLLITGRAQIPQSRLKKIALFDQQHLINPTIEHYKFAEGKDGSYAGLCIDPAHPNEVIISYYSDHEVIGTANRGKFNEIWVEKLAIDLNK